MKVALYARVSKAEDQTPENQLIQLRQWASSSNSEIVGEFSEAVSSRDTRPVKEELRRRLRLGEIDAVAFVSLDRWGRNMSELVMDIEEATSSGRSLISLKEGLRFDTAAGKLYAHLLAAFASFERERIRERTIAGLNRARAQGKVLGRPRKTPPVNPESQIEVEAQQIKNVRFSTTQSYQNNYLEVQEYLRHKVLALSNNKCGLCGGLAEFVDHKIPIAEGGSATDEANMQPLCYKCNVIKTKEDLSRMAKKRATGVG